MEGRVARLEGAFAQFNERLGGIERGLDRIEQTVETRFAQIDQKFTWLTGIVVGTWITTILTVLFHH